MCINGGGGSAPPPQAPVSTTPPPPSAVDPAILAARQNLITQAAMAKGRASTIVDQTGDQGSSEKKKLTGQ